MADRVRTALRGTADEATLLFDYSVGAVSRASFFSEAPEVDYLALQVTAGVTTAGAVDATFTAGPPGAVRPSGPLGAGSPGATGDRAGDRPLSGAGLGGPALLSVLFVTHAHWLLRSYAQYSRQHPLHANATPIYG